jgi:hypothetical protein
MKRWIFGATCRSTSPPDEISEGNGQGDKNSSLRWQRRRALDDLLSERRAKRAIGLPGREQTDSLRQRSPATAGGRLILRDAHPGTTVNTLRSINPSVQRDHRPGQIAASLDPFNPKNGFNPSGSSNFAREFKERYFRAQAVRMNRLVDAALAKLRAMAAGKYLYNDDDAFVIHKSEGGRLSEMDLTIQPGTVNPQKLLKNDGTIVTEIIKSVRVPAQNAERVNRSTKDRNF